MSPITGSTTRNLGPIMLSIARLSVVRVQERGRLEVGYGW